MHDSMNAVEQAIRSRQSIRSFLPDPVPPAIIRRILEAATCAPSGSNIQPWQVHVLTGKRRDALSQALLNAHRAKEPERRGYQYYPAEWREPYLQRRRETGWGLYQWLGIGKGDREAADEQRGHNYAFFGAPCVMMFTIDDDMGTGSWLDYGMFLQNIMVMARGLGLDTCPQAALANYPDIVREHLGLSDNQVVICGISIGYRDPDALVNRYRPSRVEVDSFTVFHDD
ncbi:nitroreductase [Bordetella sp. 15P40C-2]|nr:nitroreductase [Bordetella sp. 15P40C-2]